ncbi:tRNA threonylcarbamoyladenosine biosynthesis protein RimN [Pseudoxanthomonas broegbernensis]|uniref:Threonylcarbamoyl-AMP synthase n=1 Tax=Pseudoxanthomonas broegbernensis TaxID=83619 RepID=A0A7V8GKR3_9GAMM|nr:Sua5/YciO/YrdC/YwlC family protein [Pseudoxanthomonas broegbernensis]KAF1685277.1 tRNA threonylcarbamoyladenosine biosynthesis protein RimN [Pseudoxanthomonas broegbernensis]MBB6066114.1 L-threonylcarbamoyladenylate synthase [Pseudoxanthomonas broegbernensis]
MPAPLTPAAAAVLLRHGGVVAYPTEAVWGLGCDPDDEAAVMRLLAAKQRPVDKGLILVAAHFDALRPWLDLSALPPERLAAVRRDWPGPHTWVMPASARAPRWITGRHDGIAVRVSAHPDVAALCRAFGGPLVSTSANRAGMPPARSRAALDPGLVADVDGLLPGETGGLDQPTPIRVALDGRVLRD